MERHVLLDKCVIEKSMLLINIINRHLVVFIGICRYKLPILLYDYIVVNFSILLLHSFMEGDVCYAI